MNFKLTKTKILFKGKVFDLKVDEIEYNSGNKGIREIAVHPGGAVVVPITNEGKLLMVTQFRYPFQTTLLEFPAGKLDIDEDPLDCAVRELEEETGYKAAKVNEIGKIYTAPGYSSEMLHIYVAQELKKGEHKREEGEYGMEIYEFEITEIEDKILSEEIIDAKTICAVYLLKSKITL
jgi:ADP-ribose pyrophosphatase